MKESGLAAVGRFARVVSDAGHGADILERLADALFEHAAPAVAVFALEPDGRLRLAAQRGLDESVRAIEVDLDDVDKLPQLVMAAAGPEFVAHVNRPLVAAASLYGDAVLLVKTKERPELALIDVLVDLAAMSLGTAAHVAQLERQSSELRAQQELLVRSEKLRALGQMAAGISHDLKNILNPLSLHLQVVTRSIDRGKLEDAKESLDEIKQTLTRGVQTLERLRSFSRKESDAKTELVSLDTLVREAAAIGKSRAASGSGRVPKLVEELGAPPPVSAIGSEIVAALVNLVVNAVDAGASTITLRSGHDESGSWVEIADDGPGMPPEIAKRVFEPFFTTKGAEGTGLGLAMVYATMERHGGGVTIDTAEGKGTRFRLHFLRA